MAKTIKGSSMIVKKSREQSALKGWQQTALMAVIIAVAVWLVYHNTLGHSFHFDDTHAIQMNEDIRDLSTFKDLSYWKNVNNRPLVMFSFAMNYDKGKLDPAPYHITNIAIHIIASIFVYLLILKLFNTAVMRRRPISRHGIYIALFTALLFALHPVQVQSVTYIVQRMASMAWMFALGSLLAYIHGRMLHTSSEKWRQAIVFYVLAAVSWIAAMLSKQSAAAMLLVIIAAEYIFIFNPGRKSHRIFLAGTLGVMVSGVVFVLITGWIPNEKGALPPIEYLATQMKVILKYMQISIIPVNLILDYKFPLSHSLFEPFVLISMMVHIAVLAVAFFIRKKNPLISFGIFLFYLPLAVTSTIFPIRDVIFEHRIYLPVAGAALIVVCGIFHLLHHRQKYLPWIVMSVIVLLMGFGTVERNKVWKDFCSLWEDTLKKAPGNSRAWLAVGDCLKQRQDVRGALEHYNQALLLDSSNFTALNNRGNLKLMSEDYLGAIVDYNRIIKYSEESRYFTLYNRGVAYLKMGEQISALDDFNKIIKETDADVETYYYRALTYVYLGEYPKAILDLQIVLEREPANQDALFSMANARINNDELEEAVEYYTRLLALDPNHGGALHYRGVAYRALRNNAQACEDLRRAAALQYPPSAELVRRYCTEVTL